MLQFCSPKVQLGATNNTYELAMDNRILQLYLNLNSRYADNVKIVVLVPVYLTLPENRVVFYFIVVVKGDLIDQL